ncbi:MAG: hypothetical protein ACRELX_11050, partial [Longimicrobiales bacterium]
LMVGSMGRLGVIVELTFKVFPAPPASRTLRVTCRDLADAVARVVAVGGMPLDLEAIELEPPAILVIRVAGNDSSIAAHAERVGGATERPFEMLSAEDDVVCWRAQRGFTWLPAAHWLIKAPLTPPRVEALDCALERHAVMRRYSVAANVAWLAWPADRPLAGLDLAGLGGLVVMGPSLEGASPWVGARADAAGAFARGVKSALDPERRMPQLI